MPFLLFHSRTYIISYLKFPIFSIKMVYALIGTVYPSLTSTTWPTGEMQEWIYNVNVHEVMKTIVWIVWVRNMWKEWISLKWGLISQTKLHLQDKQRAFNMRLMMHDWSNQWRLTSYQLWLFPCLISWKSATNNYTKEH